MGISNGSPLKRLPAALPARLPLQRTSTDPGNHDRNRHGNGFPAVYQYRRLQKSLFMLDTSFEHFHYLPNTPEGEVLLKLLVHPEIMESWTTSCCPIWAAAAIQFHWNMMPRMLPGTPSFLLMILTCSESTGSIPA